MMLPERLSVIGAGPVGALAALYFAKHCDVTVFEARSGRITYQDITKNSNRADLKTEIKNAKKKSISLALSDRGIEALRGAGGHALVNRVLDGSVPMYARLIHHQDGHIESQPYDVHGRHLYAINREKLIKVLLKELEQHPRISLEYNHKLECVDFNSGKLVFQTDTDATERQTTKSVEFNLVVGCDGAHSTVRRDMISCSAASYFEKDYVDRFWCELLMPCTETTHDWALPPTYLHIWPRKSYMLCAFPNQDKTFTCTLFMPQNVVDQIGTSENLVKLFRRDFPDVIDVIGEESLCEQYFTNGYYQLLNIVCSPHVYENKAVIVGDAAHCMQPFYGQGLNTGFEDLRVLCAELGVDDGASLKEKLKKYTEQREPDAKAITELALQNYTEMCLRVTSRIYLLQKKWEELVFKYVPALGIKPLYTMVTFSPDLRFSVVKRRAARQRILFKVLLFFASLVGVVTITNLALKLARYIMSIRGRRNASCNGEYMLLVTLLNKPAIMD